MKNIYLLQTYWTKYDFDTKFSRFFNGISIYNTIALLANAYKSQRIVKDNHLNTCMLYSEESSFFYHMNFFGFGDYELNDADKAFYKDSIKDFLPNEFGIYVSKFLISKALMFWNTRHLNYLISVLKKRLNLKKIPTHLIYLRNFFLMRKLRRQ